MQAVADGGNAVDAALAAMLVALVSEPGVASVGGGAFVTVAPPGGPAVTVDGTVAMPGLGLPRSAFGRGLDEVRDDVRRRHRAPRSGTAPSRRRARCPRSSWRTSATARLPWREVVAPAAHRARDGFPLGAAASRYLDVRARGDLRPGRRRARHPAGRRRHAAAGRRHHAPHRARRTSSTASRPRAPRRCCAGDVAASLVADMTANGGLVTHEDLHVVPRRRPPGPDPAACATGSSPRTRRPPSAARCWPRCSCSSRASAAASWGWARSRSSPSSATCSRTGCGPWSRRPGPRDGRGEMLAAIAEAGPAWNRSPSTAHVSAVDSDGAGLRDHGVRRLRRRASSSPGTGVWLNNCLGRARAQPRRHPRPAAGASGWCRT